jgi:glutamyl-tRNA reductase
VSSTGSREPIITRAMFEPLRKARRYRPIFFIDIALPRDVEACVGELENVYLYNLDDLQHVVAGTHATRGESVDHARKIVEEQVERYVTWTRARELGPMIDRLYQRHHDLARGEVDRIANKLGDLTPAQREQLDELARRIVNKLLHDPIKALRRGRQPARIGADVSARAGEVVRLEGDNRTTRQKDNCHPDGTPKDLRVSSSVQILRSTSG